MQLTRTHVILLSICTGLVVANIYYCQPLIVAIAGEFQIPAAQAGQITYLTQAGYAAGLLVLVPLGDMVRRRRQIVICTLVSITALMMAAFSPNLTVLSLASFIIGFTSIVPQLILPLSANLTGPEKRGVVVGTIMSGLLVGIILSRTLSGFIGDAFGWRNMYILAGLICLAVAWILYRILPESRGIYKGSYMRLFYSMAGMVREQPVLRQCAAINALAFATFSTFWTTMVLLLAGEPYFFTANRIGMFGLVGAAGALAAPLVGRLAGSREPLSTIRTGIVLKIIAILLAFMAPKGVLWIIAVIIILDLGHQAIHVTNQTRIYSLLPEFRNRLNTVFMTCSFIGASAGSAIGLGLWKLGGWNYTCFGAMALLLAAGALTLYRPQTHAEQY